MDEVNLEHTVVLKRCEEYDPEAIEKIVSEGMHTLGYKPKGKVFVKPNVVVAFDPEIFGVGAYTNKELVRASILALARSGDVERIDLGENCGVGFPTRMAYNYAGYYGMVRETSRAALCPVEIFCIDEEPRDSVFVGGKVHDNLRIARKMARADTMVYMPKLKCHCVSNMTGAVKLNIGICSDDERSIRHDFMLNEKIVDLLKPGWPDLVIMEAIDVGVGNEAFPDMRKLGLVIMGRNPIAVDLVAARLLGFGIQDIPYLKAAIDRGYTPRNLEEVNLAGDLTSIQDLDQQAQRIMPYDDAYYRWQDVEKELKQMNSPMRFFWGPYSEGGDEKCLTGCVMGIKMFLGMLEKYAGSEAFAKAKPVVFVIGRYGEKIDAKGNDVYLLGSCASAEIVNPGRISHIDKCFTTASDMHLDFGHKLGLPTPLRDTAHLWPFALNISRASIRKTTSMRYLQDLAHFLQKR